MNVKIWDFKIICMFMGTSVVHMCKVLIQHTEDSERVSRCSLEIGTQ